jgi:hypothetical protein
MFFFFLSCLVGIFFVILFTPTLASAYLDPGTGSYFFQLFIAFLVGALYSIKLFWNKIVHFLKGLFKIKS